MSLSAPVAELVALAVAVAAFSWALFEAWVMAAAELAFVIAVCAAVDSAMLLTASPAPANAPAMLILLVK
ncbi:hypothetical protein BFF94_007055 [Burkholderia catarinensis]|nr:hypothetical protein BFF94_007055 [Burkholderia catarinensis]